MAKALGRLADEIPVMPGEEDACFVEARCADALVALCSERIARDPDPDRATVVVHADLAMLAGDDRNAQVEDGPAIAADTARRLACNARIQIVLEDTSGRAVGLGRISREPTAAMLRQVRHRDHGCVFPGCGTRRFTQAHHIVWWRDGGRTDLDNLALVCSFHHKLVHEHGWRMSRDDGGVRWFRPDGSRCRAGPPAHPPVTRPRRAA